MLSKFGLSKHFWAEAINMAYYLVNRSPSTVIEFKTPFEVWFGTLADYSCKDQIWVGPKLGLDFNPISPKNEFVERE